MTMSKDRSQKDKPTGEGHRASARALRRQADSMKGPPLKEYRKQLRAFAAHMDELAAHFQSGVKEKFRPKPTKRAARKK